MGSIANSRNKDGKVFDPVLCRFLRPIAGALLVTPIVAVAADATSYPTKPLRFVVTFAPGGDNNVLTLRKRPYPDLGLTTKVHLGWC